jgi:hypothetical protein
MPRYAPNKMPGSVKKRYFELVRQGLKGAGGDRESRNSCQQVGMRLWTSG